MSISDRELRDIGFTGWASVAAFGLVTTQLVNIEMTRPGVARGLLMKLADSVESIARSFRSIK